MSSRIRWGILSTGRIAAEFAEDLKTSDTAILAAVASRDEERAEAFAREHSIPDAFGSYETLLASKEIDVVYIATPHPFHKEWAIKAAESGKHILCEKPLAMNRADAKAMIQAARENDVFLMEAFMYRCHPQTAKVIELIRDNALGQIRAISSSFSIRMNFDPRKRHFNPELGGGAILDLGCYPASLSRMIAGAALDQDFAEPVQFKSVGRLNPKTGVDEHTSALCKFPNDITAELGCSLIVDRPQSAFVYGAMGFIEIPEPWFCGRTGKWELILHYEGEKPQIISGKTQKGLYAHEADFVADNLDRKEAPSPAMSWNDTLGNMRFLDRWLKSLK